MLTSLEEKYDICFNVQAKRRAVHATGYCGTELNFDIDCCSGQSTKICYMPSSKKIFSNLTALQNIALEEMISQTY